MKQLEAYAALPLENIMVGRDLILEFFTDHSSRLKSAVDSGTPFAELVSPFQECLARLADSKTGTAVNLAQQGSETMTVDNYIQQFKDSIKTLEPKVMVQFPKDSVEYHEFFPQGKTAYSRITKGNIDNLFATVLAACEHHKGKLGQALKDEFATLQSNYVAARNKQLEKKGSTSSTRSAWDDNLDAIKDLAFHNLLVIADNYRGQPEKIRLYFDQSIITLDKHKQAADSTAQAYTLAVPASATAVANINFALGDTLLVTNTGDVPLYYYGASSAAQATPPNPTEIADGDEAEITAASLGAPANKYLLFVNNDKDLEGKVEIMMM